MVDYFVSGTVEVCIDRRPVPLGGEKQRCVLAVLLTHHGTVVSIDRLIDAIWDDEPPAKALTSLRSYIANLRRIVPATADTVRLETRPHGYRLNVADSDTVDLHRFAGLVGRGRAELNAADPAPAFTTLSRALALWRGDPLGEFAYREFAAAAVRRYTALRTTAVEARFDAGLRLGRADELIPEIEAALTEDPLQEPLWGHLMWALHQAGRSADAIQTFDRAHSTLEREIGAAPGEGLRTLLRKINDRSADLVPGRNGPAAARTAPYVGRDTEIRSVHAATRAAGAGSGALTLVTGESGIGKTSLARVVAERAAADGLPAVWASHAAGIRLPRMWTWIQVLRQLGADLGADVRRTVCLAAPGVVDALVPEWNDDIAPIPATGFALAEGVVTALRALAQTRPLMLVLDDLHQADTASIEALALLTAQFPRLPLHVVANWTFYGADRPVNAAAFAQLIRSNDTATVTLRGIDRTAAGRLVDAITGDAGSAEVTDRIWQRAGGNPFYIKELSRTLGVSGDGVSDAVAGIVDRRLGALDPATRRVVSAAAVVGRGFAAAELADIINRPVSAVQSRLRSGYAAGLFDEVPDHPGHYRFSHALLRDAVLAQLPMTDRTRVHAAIAAAHAPAVATSAYEAGIAAADHAWLAGAELHAETALDIHEIVIRRALCRSAYADVAVLSEHALQISDRLPAKPEHLERQATLWLHLAGAKGILEGQISQAARDAVQRAFEIGDHLKDHSFYGAVTLQCLMLIGRGHLDEAQTLANGLREQYLRSRHPDAGIASDVTHVSLHFLRGELDAAIATGEHMMANFPAPETVTDPLHYLHPRVYCWMALGAALRGDIPANNEYCRLAKELALSRGDVFNVLAADLTVIESAAILGDVEGTAARAAEVDRKFRAAGGNQWAAVARIVCEWAQFMETGTGDAAAAHRAFDEYTGDGTVVMSPLFLCLLADIETRCGRADEAGRLLVRARTVAERIGESAWNMDIERRAAVQPVG